MSVQLRLRGVALLQGSKTLDLYLVQLCVEYRQDSTRSIPYHPYHKVKEAASLQLLLATFDLWKYNYVTDIWKPTLCVVPLLSSGVESVCNSTPSFLASLIPRLLL